LNESWLFHLKSEFEQMYMQSLKTFLLKQKQDKRLIYPQGKDIFNAFNSTTFEDVKVVILGQDPYHGPNQAHGLSFSVPKGERIPPSLQNIYKELIEDVGFNPPVHGHLQSWADQGVLLLNSVLTVEHQQAASHKNQGWEQFTDCVIQKLSDYRENLVFLLWGAYAIKKGQSIDAQKHLVLTAPHPSPLSAHRGFLGCRHFSQANAYLESNGIDPIHWQLES
jgi:uracil-DNA glycosylase